MKVVISFLNKRSVIYLIRVSINFCLLLKRGSSEWCDLWSVAEPSKTRGKSERPGQ